ncbi:MAG TPA: hypothetical protein VI485_27410 [Vicinamibacterales bacterium]|nr:hypothetical protein [Vicinamibacterales bacterium]
MTVPLPPSRASRFGGPGKPDTTYDYERPFFDSTCVVITTNSRPIRNPVSFM